MKKDMDLKQGQALDPCQFVETLPDKEYDAIGRLASFICDAPIAFVYLVTNTNRSFKSCQGLKINEIQAVDPFYVHTMASEAPVFMIQDVRRDKRFNMGPIATANIVFYAGAALYSFDGTTLGTLCVMDRRPRTLDLKQLDAFRSLADQVVQAFEFRKKSRELEESKHNLRLQSDWIKHIIDATRVGIWEWEIATGKFKVSGRWSEMVGYSPQELEPITIETWHGLLHPEDKALSEERLAACFQKKEEYYDLECRIRHKEGHWVWISRKGRVIQWDSEGKPLLMAGSHIDITERKENEKKIIQNEAYLLEAQRLAKMGSWNFDFKEDRLIWSEALYDVFGVAREGFLETHGSFLELIDPEYRELVRSTSEHTQRTGESFHIQYRITTPAGQKKIIEEHGYGEKDRDGNIVRLFGTAQEITELKEAEERIRQSNERYDYVNKATNDAIYDWDVVQDEFQWGEAFKRTFGYTRDPDQVFRLRDWVGLMYPLDRDKNKESWDRFLADPQQTRWNKEFRFQKADGTFTWVEEIGHMIRGHNGKPKRMIGALRDISEVKKAKIQDQIQQQLAHFFKEGTEIPGILQKVLQYLVEIVAFRTAEIWLKGNDGKRMGLIATYCTDKESERFYQEGQHLQHLEPGEGLPGEVWQREQMVIWDQIDTDSRFLRHKGAKQLGLRSAYGLPLFHNDGLVGVLVLCTNNLLKEDTERVKPLEGLQHFLGGEIRRKQQEEEMHLLFHSAPEIIAIASPNGHFSKVNPAFCELLGYTEEELTSRPFTDFVHLDDLTPTMKEYGETMTGKRNAENFINRYRTRDGNYRWISWNSSDEFGEEGQVFAFGRDVTEVKELENLLENASKLARIGSWEVDLEEGTVYFSKITREIHELAEGAVLDLQSCFKYYPEGMVTLIKETINGDHLDAPPWDHELSITTAGGNERWVRSMGQGEFKDGKCVRLYGSLQDIHRQKTAELERQRAFQEKNNILESIGDAFFAVDRDWTVTYWNREAEKILGKEREEIVGRKLWDSYPDAIGLKFHSQYTQAMESGETVHFDEYYPVTKQWFEVSAYPSGNGLSVYFKDVSIRKIAEEHIRLSNERFEKIAQATNDAVWDYNMENGTLFWGKGFATLFGHDTAKVRPSFDKWLEFIHPEDRQEVTEKLQHAVTDPNCGNWFGEYRFLRDNGSYAYVMDRAIFIRNQEGKAVQAVGAITDISYRKEYEDSLMKLNDTLEMRAKELAISNAELEQFAYVASHDLQEPLRMVTSFLTQLEKKYRDALDDKAHTYIYYAVDGASRMRQIILDLLEFSRVGKHNDTLKEVSLNDVVDEVKQLLHRKIEDRNATVVANNLPIFHTYRTPLVHIMQNLMANAIKYSRPGIPPKVHIWAEERANEWVIAVNDNGIGIDSEYFDKIFVIFQRLHTKGEYMGTGMGLSIVKKNIENLGGKIWVDSQPGEGSTFYFTLLKHMA